MKATLGTIPTEIGEKMKVTTTTNEALSNGNEEILTFHSDGKKEWAILDGNRVNPENEIYFASWEQDDLAIECHSLEWQREQDRYDEELDEVKQYVSAIDSVVLESDLDQVAITDGNRALANHSLPTLNGDRLEVK